MPLIAGMPSEEVDKHNAKVLEMKRQGFELALMVARLSPDERKNTGFKDAGEVILYTAKNIEKLTRALERKYPMD